MRTQAQYLKVKMLILMLILTAGCKPTATTELSERARIHLPDLDQCNVIMISLDTLRQDHLGMYGYNRNVSPFLDYLSRRSLFFTDVFSQSPATNSSHYSLFTSRYLSNFYTSRLEKDKTLAGMLSLQGWKTAAITDGGMLSPYFMEDKGFDTVDSKRQIFSVVLKKARDWIRVHLDNRFFLFLHTYQIHPPFFPRPLFHAIFRDNYKPSLNLQRMKTKKLTSSALTPDDYDYLKGAYDAKIRHCDTLLEKFFHFLRAIELDQKTVIVIVSDHGESIGERNYVGHCQLYEVQLRVPLLIILPGMYSAIVEEPVENIDIVPTLLSLLQLPIPTTLQGHDLSKKIYQQGAQKSQRLRISEYSNRSIRSADGWKFIIRDHPKNDELYYIPDDPVEVNNLVQQHPEKAARFKSEIIKKIGSSEKQLRRPITEMRATEGINSNTISANRTERDKELLDQLAELGYID